MYSRRIIAKYSKISHILQVSIQTAQPWVDWAVNENSCSARNVYCVWKNSNMPNNVGFLTTPRVGIDFFVRLRLRKSKWIIFYTSYLSWEFLLKWHSFFWNFCWNREFLLRTTISSKCLLLQNSWQPNFIHFMLKIRSWCRNWQFWKGRSRTFFFRLRNSVQCLSKVLLVKNPYVIQESNLHRCPIASDLSKKKQSRRINQTLPA